MLSSIPDLKSFFLKMISLPLRLTSHFEQSMAAPPLPPLGHHGGGHPAHHTMASHGSIYPPIVLHGGHPAQHGITLQLIITHRLEFNWITRIQSITIYSKTYRRDCLTLSHQGGILSMLLDGSQHATYTYTNCSALSHQPTNNYLPP